MYVVARVLQEPKINRLRAVDNGILARLRDDRAHLCVSHRNAQMKSRTLAYQGSFSASPNPLNCLCTDMNRIFDTMAESILPADGERSGLRRDSPGSTGVRKRQVFIGA